MGARTYWGRSDMEMLSALLGLFGHCRWIPVTQRSIMRNVDDVFVVGINKFLNEKAMICQWFQTLRRPCDVTVIWYHVFEIYTKSLGLNLNTKCRFASIGTPLIKIRWFLGRLIYICVAFLRVQSKEILTPGHAMSCHNYEWHFS